jgi:hypothetical protein
MSETTRCREVLALASRLHWIRFSLQNRGTSRSPVAPQRRCDEQKRGGSDLLGSVDLTIKATFVPSCSSYGISEPLRNVGRPAVRRDDESCALGLFSVHYEGSAGSLLWWMVCTLHYVLGHMRVSGES